MVTGDSRKKLIPPTQFRVKAGFVVSSPQDEDKKIILLNEGELVALDPKENNKVAFKIHAGNLVGVGALLEREPVRYISRLRSIPPSRLSTMNAWNPSSRAFPYGFWRLSRQFQQEREGSTNPCVRQKRTIRLQA